MARSRDEPGGHVEKSMPGGKKKGKQAGLCLESVRTTRGQWAGSGQGRRARRAGDRKGNSDQMSQGIIQPAELPARMGRFYVNAAHSGSL